jgi:phospholipid/cholesterol/gamma-HCH transport system permease protein
MTESARDPRPGSTGFSAEYDPGAGRLVLAGACPMASAPTLARELERLRTVAPGSLQIDLSAAGDLDIGPAWLLHGAVNDLRAAGSRVDLHGPAPRHFAYFAELEAQGGGAMPVAPTASLGAWLTAAGRRLEEHGRSAYESLVFGGRLLASAATAWRSVKRLRIPSVVRHMHETGVQAIPVVAVIAFLISVISAYIGAQQLRPFGAEIFTVDLVAIGVLRELGVLLTAIMVAGRTGSAYAAELGVMKLNDEVDALESMGLNPYEVLVLPRVVALVLVLPLLTVVADAMGLAGGALLTSYLIDLPWSQFVMRLDSAVGDTTFWAGLVKAPVFGLLIALTGTLRGLQVRESSRELGRLTTVAVVQSIFLVIFADALFAIFFLEIDF